MWRTPRSRAGLCLLVAALVWGSSACKSADAQKKEDEQAVLEAAPPTQAPSAEELMGPDSASEASEASEAGEASPDGAAAAASSSGPAASNAPTPGIAVDPGLNSQIQAALQVASSGDTAGALRRLEDLVEMPRGGHLAAYNKAVLHERLGQFDQAARAYYKSLQLDPDFSPALVNLVRLYIRQGKTQDALQIADKQINLRPRNLNLRVARLDVLLEQGKHEDVIRQSKELLRQNERNVDAMLALAKANYKLGRFELAKAVILRAVDIAPTRAELFMRYGMIELKLENKPNAIVNFRRAVELNPNYPEANNNLGVLYHEARDFDAAITAFSAAARDNPSFKEAYLNLGNAYKGARKYKESEQAFRKAIALDERYGDAYFNLAVLYLESPVPELETVARLQRSIEIFTKYKEVMGGRLAKNDPVEKYIAEARKAIEFEKQKQEMMRQRQLEGEQPES